MEKKAPSEFDITFEVKENSLECISLLPSEFSEKEQTLFKNRIPLVKTEQGDYELSDDFGEVYDETPARYIHYRLKR